MKDSMNTKFFVDMEDIYGAHNYHPLDVVITKAKGIWVWDVEGNKYLDFLSAYSAVNQGHCHPRIVKALVEQAKKVTLTSRAFRNDQWPLLAKELCDLTGYQMVLPMNSGAEAVETALKAARMWAYQKKGVPENQAEIITCANNFHGRTITIIGFSTEPLYRQDFGPYGDLKALEQAITPNTAAFLVEPIQAEAGIIIPPPGYLRQAKEICEKNNVLFIADEIQTGAVLSDREVLGLFTPGSHGSTFGGNPLACAIARESLRVIQEEELIENAAHLGDYFLEKLRTIRSRHIKEVRGKGLLIGIELYPEAGGARRFCEALKEEGLLCLHRW